MDLSVVIISHNSAHFLEPCLQSFAANPTSYQMEILVIDNQSTDETAEVVSRYPHVKLISNKKRYSFAKNNNIGIIHSIGRYILLQNPDTAIYSGSLDTLVAFMEAYPQVGACGPKLLNPDGTLQASSRYFPTPVIVAARGTFLRNVPPFKQVHDRYIMSNWDHNQTREVDWILGASLLVRRETIADVGLLDTKFLKYYEEIDWCYRIKQHGWKIYYITDAKVMHHYQRDSAKNFNKNTLLHIRSILRYFWKHKLNTA